jgi:hypothetical protein
MKKFKVIAPVEVDVVFFDCKFVKGEHICQDENKVKIFKDWGFKVEELKEEAPKTKKKAEK